MQFLATLHYTVKNKLEYIFNQILIDFHLGCTKDPHEKNRCQVSQMSPRFRESNFLQLHSHSIQMSNRNIVIAFFICDVTVYRNYGLNFRPESKQVLLNLAVGRCVRTLWNLGFKLLTSELLLRERKQNIGFID